MRYEILTRMIFTKQKSSVFIVLAVIFTELLLCKWISCVYNDIALKSMRKKE